MKDTGTKTTSLTETVAEIVGNLFPIDDIQRETDEQRRVREELCHYAVDLRDPPFTAQEIRATNGTDKMAKKKAPGGDHITMEMTIEIFKSCPTILETVFNKCLELGSFPEVWERPKLILLNKPGKNPGLSGSYDPFASSRS
ncbi:hypothetical protein AVEN_115336-1 [Araneus ventricosus]|uniref:Retrovirus-related Pol polyprotein from type-1 retrotransposable element R1 n=1 Tax=Araneus ventricosus TaxID=182803 RepID=A0A4Y1ZYC0_ARAVE|nr:hypothetical protein AVEN_115336-1 [Araneus ventricosus]